MNCKHEGEMESSHWHRCSTCFVKWTCSDGCTRRYEPPNYQYVECQECQERYEERMDEELKFELDRFAAFVEAIRDLLRWIDVANKLELGSVVLRSNVEQVLDRRGCDCVCEVDYELCMSHEIRSELSRSFDVEMVLRKEGELLEKGATR